MKTKSLCLVACAFVAALLCFSTDLAEAQHRGRGRIGRPVVVRTYRPFYGRPFFYDPFLYPGFAGSLWWGSPYWYFPPYPYGYYGGAYYRGSAARLMVTPKQTEVYVDGYLAGMVDEFDGVFQSLRLTPGAHEITLYLEGHRIERQQIYLTPDSTFKLRHTMVPLGPGEQAEPRPVPSEPPAAGAPGPAEPRHAAPGRPGPPRGGPGPAGPPPAARSQGLSGQSGTLAIRVQPADAEIFIDGERWQGPSGPERLEIRVPDGPHRIEVRKEGYQSFSTEFQVRGGQTTPVNVSLPRQD